MYTGYFAKIKTYEKAVNYRCGGAIYGNQRDIIHLEKEIKRLCKLRDCAKAMEKAAGLKMGEKNG